MITILPQKMHNKFFSSLLFICFYFNGSKSIVENPQNTHFIWNRDVFVKLLLFTSIYFLHIESPKVGIIYWKQNIIEFYSNKVFENEAPLSEKFSIKKIDKNG